MLIEVELLVLRRDQFLLVDGYLLAAYAMKMLRLGYGVNKNDCERNQRHQRSEPRCEVFLSSDVEAVHSLREEVALTHQLFELVF